MELEGNANLTANSAGANVALAICVDLADFACRTFDGTSTTAIDIRFILVQNAIGACGRN